MCLIGNSAGDLGVGLGHGQARLPPRPQPGRLWAQNRGAGARVQFPSLRQYALGLVRAAGLPSLSLIIRQLAIADGHGKIAAMLAMLAVDSKHALACTGMSMSDG